MTDNFLCDRITVMDGHDRIIPENNTIIYVGNPRTQDGKLIDGDALNKLLGTYFESEKFVTDFVERLKPQTGDQNFKVELQDILTDTEKASDIIPVSLKYHSALVAQEPYVRIQTGDKLIEMAYDTDGRLTIVVSDELLADSSVISGIRNIFRPAEYEVVQITKPDDEKYVVVFNDSTLMTIYGEFREDSTEIWEISHLDINSRYSRLLDLDQTQCGSYSGELPHTDFDQYMTTLDLFLHRNRGVVSDHTYLRISKINRSL